MYVHLNATIFLRRYIFTMLSPLAQIIFSPLDDEQLTYLYDDNLRIEPEWYCPSIPMVLINGAEGIGTGYSTFIPNYNPKEVVANLKRLINGLEPIDMVRIFVYTHIYTNTYMKLLLCKILFRHRGTRILGGG